MVVITSTSSPLNPSTETDAAAPPEPEAPEPERKRALSMVAPVVIGTIPLLTALLVWLGPDASPAGSDSALSPGAAAEALSEPTDQIILVLWVLSAVVITALLAWGRPKGGAAYAPGWVLPAALPGTALLVAGLLYGRDELGIAGRIEPLDFIAGVGIAVALVLLAAYGSRIRRAANAVMLAAAAGLFIPVLIQLPDRLGDVFHARVAFEDMLAVAAGATPWHDYFPLYGALLGYPIAPFIALAPGSAAAIVTYWTVGLQAATLAVAISLVTWAGGKRYLGPAAIIVPSLALTGGPPGIGPFTYFQVNPIRTVLPVIAIAIACWALSGRRRASTLGWRVMAGAVAGIAALNNPDFGIGLAIVVIGTSALAARDGRRIRALVATVGGVAAPFLAWTAASWIAGVPADWPRYLMFQRLFGPEGYMSIPMTAIGWHVGAVVLFVSTMVTGALLVIRTGNRPRGRQARFGVLLTLTGGWSLLTLPYFMGRSLTPTLTGGYALQIGWCIACLVPVSVMAIRWLRGRSGLLPDVVVFSVASGLTAVAIAGVGLLHTWPAGGWDLEAHPPINTTGQSLPAKLAAAPDAVRSATAAGQVAQIIDMPALTQITTGLPSASAFSQADQVGTSPILADAQCRVMADLQTGYVVVLAGIVPALEPQGACRDYDFDAVVLFGTPETPGAQPPFAAVPRRSGLSGG